MQIVYKPLSEIAPYENNPRNLENAVDAVAESIRQFGFNQPIVLDQQNVVVCGHTRLQAALKLGLKDAPCVMVENLTPQQVKAYRLLDNKLHEKTTWNLERLQTELERFNFDFEPFDVDFKSDLERFNPCGSNDNLPSVFNEDFLEDQVKPHKDDEELSVDVEKSTKATFQLIVQCPDEVTQAQLYEELRDQGYQVKICNL